MRPHECGVLLLVGALKQYDLMIEEGGAGRQRKLKLTELALRIILDDRPESEERERFKAQAARAPAIMDDIYERWPEGSPSEQTLKHFLVLDRHFNDQTASKAVRIIKENELFTVNTVVGNLSADGKTYSDQPARQEPMQRQERTENYQRDQPAPATVVSITTPAPSFPMGQGQYVRLESTAPLTRNAIEALIKQLQVGLELGLYPDSSTEPAC